LTGVIGKRRLGKERRASISYKKMIQEGTEDGGGTVASEELSRDDGVCEEEEVEKGGGQKTQLLF